MNRIPDKHPEMPHFESPSLVFFFPIADIQEEVYKRTSYLGKMRIPDSIHNLDGVDNVNDDIERNTLDRLSLTNGEDFMFTEFLEEAAAETYDWVKAFGRNVKRAYQVEPAPKTEVMWENDGLCITSDNTPLNVSAACDIPVNFSYVGTTMTTTFVTPLNLKAYAGVSASLLFRLSGVVTNANGVSLEKELATSEQSVSLAKDGTSTISSKSFTLPNSDADGALTYSDIHLTVELANSTPATVIDLALDTYIEYNYYTSATEYNTSLFLVIRECDSKDWELNVDNVEIDGRNKVVFTLDYPCNFDRNMIRTIERHFKEALVCYVIYRWLEYTKPDEAEAWHDRFEAHAYNAQLQMNSEVKILKRPSMWY